MAQPTSEKEKNTEMEKTNEVYIFFTKLRFHRIETSIPFIVL